MSVPAYQAPTLSTLVTVVSRDLRDPDNKTFSTDEVADFIRAGVVEVSAVNPLEVIEDIPFEADTATYPSRVIDAFRVEVYNDNGYVMTIPSNVSDDVGAQGGWELFAEALHLPWSVVPRLNTTTSDTLRVWGYRPRLLPVPVGSPASDPTLEVDAQCEQGVRTYALLEGYQRLVNSRALFQQWTQSPGNSDVSPTQLANYAQTYESQWQRIRQQMRRLRRR